MPHRIWDSIQYKINQITPKGTQFKSEVPYFWNFPSLTLEYQKEEVPCLDWIIQIYTIAEVPLRYYRGSQFLGRFFLAHYIEPKVTRIEPQSILLTPLRLLEYLTKGEKGPNSVEIVRHHDNPTVYSVKGYPKKVKLQDLFTDWIKRFSNEKGLKEFSAKMLNLDIMDAPTYDIVMSRIESKIGPKIEIPSINVEDTERLRIIYQVKIMPSYGQWVKIIEKYGKRSQGVVFKSTQGFIDFLHRMEAGDYLKVYREVSRIRIELTEKGLKVIE